MNLTMLIVIIGFIINVFIGISLFISIIDWHGVQDAPPAPAIERSYCMRCDCELPTEGDHLCAECAAIVSADSTGKAVPS
jgi:hypothetical protein